MTGAGCLPKTTQTTCASPSTASLCLPLTHPQSSSDFQQQPIIWTPHKSHYKNSIFHLKNLSQLIPFIFWLLQQHSPWYIIQSPHGSFRETLLMHIQCERGHNSQSPLQPGAHSNILYCELNETSSLLFCTRSLTFVVWKEISQQLFGWTFGMHIFPNRNFSNCTNFSSSDIRSNCKLV